MLYLILQISKKKMKRAVLLIFSIQVTFTFCVIVVFTVGVWTPVHFYTKDQILSTKTGDVSNNERKRAVSNFNDVTVTIPTSDNDITDSLVLIAKGVHKASIHAKSLKAINSLKDVEKEVTKVLKSFNIDYVEVTNHKVLAPKTVCPEEFRGAQYGFPMYQKGFETLQCSYSLSLSKVLSMVYVPDKQLSHVDFNGIANSLPNVQVYIAGRGNIANKNKYKSIEIITYGEEKTGKILNDLLKKIDTEYVLIARDVTAFDKQIRVERLIREIEILGYDVVGGATRDTERKWKIGCYQSGLRNYTLVYHQGYDESIHECVLCDMIEGPFVMKTKRIQNLKFDNTLPDHVVFEDMFLRLGLERSLVCPDSMFHIINTIYPSDTSYWTSFAKKWELHKIKFVPGLEIRIPCTQPYKCNKGKYFLASPCCVLELAEMTKHVIKICTGYKIICELNSGTLLSGVKMGNAAAWDIDGDVMFTLWNASAVDNLQNKFAGTKYKFRLQSQTKYENLRAVFAAFEIRTKNWFVEIYGKAKLTSESYMLNGRGQTLVFFNGNWLSAPVNPGLWVRNRYGKEMYRHANNWRHLGKKGSLEQYPTDSFIRCSVPGNQKCLDNYRTDGNLQFSDPIP